MSIDEAYMEKAEAELKRLQAEIERAQADAKIASIEKRAELERHLSDARDKLGLLKQAGSQAGQELKAGFENALRDLRAGWQRIMS